MVEHCVDEETALRRFYEFIGDEEYVLVGHNARDFDLNFINVRSRMYKLDEKLNDFALIDTLYLSKFVEEEVLAKQRKRKNYSLEGMLKSMESRLKIIIELFLIARIRLNYSKSC